MATLAKQIISYFKNIKLTVSDILLGIGFLFSIPFYAFAWKFMVTSDPSQIFLDNRMIITCFFMVVVCWSGYFVCEIREKRIRNNFFTWAYVFFAILSVVSVLVQPTVTSIMVECRHVNAISMQLHPGVQVGDIVEVISTISLTHRLFFTFGSFVITTIFFIILCVFPQRIRNMNFLIPIGILVFLFLLVLACHSYITEADKYEPFIRGLIEGDKHQINTYAMAGFMVMSVPYGVCMMLGVMFSLTLHAISKKWYWYIPGLFCFINMIFSYCRTSIGITLLVIFLYLTFRIIVTFKQHKIRNLIFGILFWGGVITIVVLFLVSYNTNGAFLPYFNKTIKIFADTSTIKTRSYIWQNILTELKGGWFVIGRGFGTHNYLLYPMNLVNGDNVCPSHSSYLAIMGAGGIISLLGFFGLVGYYIYVFVKCFKQHKAESIGYTFGFLGFMLYSFTEGVNYLIVVFTFPLILYYHILKKEAHN